MTDDRQGLRGFKATFTIIGVLYFMMASSALVRGARDFMGDFGVPEAIATEPVLVDFFEFFYQMMAAVGLLKVLFGHVTRGWRAQRLVSGVFCVLSLGALLRDLATSDTPFGNSLYRSDKVLVFVAISLTFAIAFGVLALGRWREAAPGAADEQDARPYQR